MVDPWERWSDLSSLDVASVVGPARSLFSLGWMRTELNNGGFDQLFFNAAGDSVPYAEAAAREAGWTELADVLKRAMSVLGQPYPPDTAARQEVLRALTESEQRRLDRMDDEYFDLEMSSDLDALMRTVISG